MDNTTTPSGVIRAISAVMADLPAIGKGDKSPEGYRYRGIEAITSKLQPLMAKHGVVIVPNATVMQIVPAVSMREGWQDVHMSVTWTIYGPDGSSITATTHGIGRDKADKGANKAMTQALKYLLLSLLVIADKADDSEAHDVNADTDPAPTAPPTAGQRLFELAKRTKGTPVEQQLRDLAAENGRKLTAAAFDADPHWAALVTATITNHEQDAA